MPEPQSSAPESSSNVNPKAMEKLKRLLAVAWFGISAPFNLLFNGLHLLFADRSLHRAAKILGEIAIIPSAIYFALYAWPNEVEDRRREIEAHYQQIEANQRDNEARIREVKREQREEIERVQQQFDEQIRRTLNHYATLERGTPDSEKAVNELLNLGAHISLLEFEKGAHLKGSFPFHKLPDLRKLRVIGTRGDSGFRLADKNDFDFEAEYSEFSDATFANIDFTAFSANESEFRGVDFSGCQIRRGSFERCDFREAIFDTSQIVMDVRYSDFRLAKFRNSHLILSHHGTGSGTFEQADFRGAKLLIEGTSIGSLFDPESKEASENDWLLAFSFLEKAHLSDTELYIGWPDDEFFLADPVYALDIFTQSEIWQEIWQNDTEPDTRLENRARKIAEKIAETSECFSGKLAFHGYPFEFPDLASPHK